VAIIKGLSEFMGIHKGEKIIVCGCGMSLLEFKEPNKYITIGVNDVPALFPPTYLVVTDAPGRFSTKRKEIVNSAGSKYLFTCANGWRHKNIVHFELGSKEVRNLESNKKIDHFVNSPFVAVNLAYKMGATHIGIIGVDFTNGHFYNPGDGAHPVSQVNYLKRVNSSYQNLATMLSTRGVILYNLSRQSRVELPKIKFEEFDKL